jgi:hypothetical protein
MEMFQVCNGGTEFAYNGPQIDKNVLQFRNAFSWKLLFVENSCTNHSMKYIPRYVQSKQLDSYSG